MTKNYLFVLRQAPHQGVLLQETLDLLLTIAAFDQHVSLLFVDDGVWQLNSGQQPEKFGLKDTAAIFNALALYEVHNVYVETQSLHRCGLTVADMSLPVTAIERQAIAAFSGQYDVVFSG